MRLSFFYITILCASFILSCKASNAVAGKEKKKKNEVVLSEDEVIKLKSSFFEGNREKMMGNADEALKHFKECIQIYPEHAPSLYEIGLIYNQISQNQTAQSVLEQVVTIDASNKWYQEALARVYEENREYVKAAGVYEKLIDLVPNEMMYYDAKANSFLLANDLKSAMKVYDQMEEQFGVTENSSLQKQKIYMAVGKNDKAIEEAKKLIEAAPGTPRYYNNLAEVYHKLGQNENALKTYEKLLEIDPNNSYVQLSMATYYYQGGRIDEGKKVMRRAFANPSLDFESKARILFTNVAYSEVPQGQVNPFALELIDIMKTPHGNEAQLYAIEGDLLSQSGKPLKARDAYNKSLSLDENQFLVWSQMLLINSEQLDWKTTFEESSKAIELFPTQGTLYYFKGVSALQLKKTEDAIDAFLVGKDLVVENKSLQGQFYSNLGDAYHQLEKFEESDKYFDLALTIDPNDMLVLNNYSYYLSLRGKNLEKAEKMSRRTVDQNPESSTYLDTYAWILYKMENYPEAKKWMQYALNNGGNQEGIIVEHFGDILFKLNDKEGALKYWQMASEIGGGTDLLLKKIETETLYE
ncbi:MAG: tetratricopeptide repeat protein [Flavobacteriales bacterium]|nr:tetratricopeptide repeat protein [Flavobacteriales bacterium]